MQLTLLEHYQFQVKTLTPKQKVKGIPQNLKLTQKSQACSISVTEMSTFIYLLYFWLCQRNIEGACISLHTILKIDKK